MTIAVDDFGFAGQRRTTDGLDRGLCSYLTPARAARAEKKIFNMNLVRVEKWRPQTSDLIGRLDSGRGVGVARLSWCALFGITSHLQTFRPTLFAF